MNISFYINTTFVKKTKLWLEKDNRYEWLVAGISLLLAVIATILAYSNDVIVTYGDAESHLNIAKRVVHSITPGAAQLGGIWLPIPHILLVPFVSIDFLWRTGLAGSIVSGISYIISNLYLFWTITSITGKKYLGFIGFFVFALNPNILYLQSTPMTELVLIMFFILSSYYFIQFIQDTESIISLILAGFFAFLASLSRYDGWFLVLFQALCIGLLFIRRIHTRKGWFEMEGKLVLYSTLAFFGMLIWMVWDWLILGDPFYFTNSQFSAKTQQDNWRSRGELPAYHNIPIAFLYYFVTAMSNSGILVFLASIVGMIFYLKESSDRRKYLIALILLIPFIFNVTTLFLGQSVIFIPHITPTTFEWTLFNVRYGVMFIPTVAFFFAYLFEKRSWMAKSILLLICVIQTGLFIIGYSQIVSLADGTKGLSKAKRPDAEQWIKREYDSGLVLIDDYARTVSIVRSGIPMQNVIYVGNQKYWEESFYTPEKYARWIIMQKDDAVWSGIYDAPHMQKRLFKYFNKVYTSPTILIFKRIENKKSM